MIDDTSHRLGKHLQNSTNTNEQLWEDLCGWEGDEAAVQKSFALGIPAYYAEPDTPPDLNIKAYPDGRLELVRYIARGVEEVVGSL